MKELQLIEFKTENTFLCIIEFTYKGETIKRSFVFSKIKKSDNGGYKISNHQFFSMDENSKVFGDIEECFEYINTRYKEVFGFEDEKPFNCSDFSENSVVEDEQYNKFRFER